eukprot:15116371-Ditylum_brightwellii.AAC.1
MVAEGIHQAMNFKDQSVENENVLNMVKNEDNSVQQQLTKMCDLIKTLQHQNVLPVLSIPPSPYPPHYYQPAANTTMQQQ